ncbi:flippase [Candidatus Woesearchaeota archaeon]|nr:flippase [Candidatus Woesearchaeota archaeon]
MSYTKRALRGSLFVFIASIITAFLGYFIRIILARNLSVEDYGLFFAVFAFISFLLFFRDLGLGSALVKHLAEFKAKKKFNAIKTGIVSVFLSLLILSAIFGVVLYLLAPFLAQNYFKDERALYIIYFFIAYILFSALFLFLRNIFQGLQKIKTFALMEPMRLGIALLTIIIFFAFEYSLFAPVIAYSLSWLAIFLIFLPFASSAFSFFGYRIKNMKKVTKQLYLFGIAIALAHIGAKVIARIDTLMLTYFTSLTEVGIYNVVLPTALLFLFFSEAISPILYPLVSELWAKKDQKKLSEGINLLYKYSFVITIPAFLTVLVFSSLIIKILFGIEYVAGSLALQILLVGILFLLVATINNTVLAAIGRPAAVTKAFLIVAGLNILLNLLLIPMLGINGAAIATAISYLALLLISTIFVARYIHFKFPLFAWAKTFLIGLVFLFIAFAMKIVLATNIWIELIITVFLAGLIYLILAYLLRLIDIKELKKYLKKAI